MDCRLCGFRYFVVLFFCVVTQVCMLSCIFRHALTKSLLSFAPNVFFSKTGVFLNLFVAIVLDTFIMFQSLEGEGDKKDEKIYVKEEDFTLFRETWFELDPGSTGMIPSSSVNELITNLHEQECRLGFDINAKDAKTTTRLASVHARCSDYDHAAVGRRQSGVARSTTSGRNGQNTVVVPANARVKQKRTVPFADLLYILSSALVPTDSLDADGFVRQALNETRVKMTLAAIKLQRWVRSLKEAETKAAEDALTTTEPGKGNRVGGEPPPPPGPPAATTKSLGLNNSENDRGEKNTERLSLHQRRKSGGTHPLTGLKLKIPK
jgi:hypothetical protein